HLFKRFHSDCCCDTTVKLPAQQVVVQTAAPRVTVQETRLTRDLAAPVIGTVYMPIAGLGMGVGAGGTHKEAEVKVESNPLRSAHEAELARLRLAQARAAAKVELDAAQRALDRTDVPCDPGKPPADLDQRLKELGTKIDKLGDRLGAVERLSLIHD